jgi:uncharacterized protein
MQHSPKTNTKTVTRHKFVRAFLFAAGSVFLGLGAIGVVLPVLPTTPFLLLALACYFRSSERMTHWMLTNKYFGKYIKNYREGKGIPLKTKVVAITILWVAILYSSFFIIPFWVAQLIMLVVAVAVTVHLVKLPTYRQKI